MTFWEAVVLSESKKVAGAFSGRADILRNDPILNNHPLPDNSKQSAQFITRTRADIHEEMKAQEVLFEKKTGKTLSVEIARKERFDQEIISLANSANPRLASLEGMRKLSERIRNDAKRISQAFSGKAPGQSL